MIAGKKAALLYFQCLSPALVGLQYHMFRHVPEINTPCLVSMARVQLGSDCESGYRYSRQIGSIKHFFLELQHILSHSAGEIAVYGLDISAVYPIQCPMLVALLWMETKPLKRPSNIKLAGWNFLLWLR